jgi:long-chain acyl-CoA synthetase
MSVGGSKKWRRVGRPYPDVPYHYWLWRASEYSGEQECLTVQNERFTYAEVEAVSNSLAHALTSLGVHRGNRVAVMAANCPESVFAANAISMCGSSFALFSPLWKSDELRHAMDLAKPTAVIADPTSAKVIDAIDCGPDIRVCIGGAYLGSDWHSFWDIVSNASAQRPVQPESRYLGNLEAALLFSSGTTGKPKALVHTNGSLSAAVINWRAALGLTSNDVVQVPVPLAHILGNLSVTAAFAGRSRVTILPRFSVGGMLESIERDRITVAFIVAPIAYALAESDLLKSSDFSSLRYLNWSATPASADIASMITAETGVDWLLAYGASEFPVISANPVQYPTEWRLDTPGLPVPNVEVSIRDPETLSFIRSGQHGEICVRGPSLMRTYLPPSANEDALLPDGWFRTGDIGYLEPDGWLHITDRSKEMLKVSGYQVSPTEIEEVILRSDDVADCAVIGTPDKILGDVPVAMIVPSLGAQPDPASIAQLVEASLAPYKRVRDVRIVDTIPRTASGKVLRRVLREGLERDLPNRVPRTGPKEDS